jgi:hypothetical protein
MLPTMADNNNRWERLTEKPGDKPVFSARQSTETFRQPGEERPRRARRHHRPRTGRLWFIIGVVVLTLLTAILGWQLFGQ